MLLEPFEPQFIVGDLNMDLRNSSKSADLHAFLTNYKLKNFVTEHTRIARNFYQKKKKVVVSKTLIDVIIHNQDKIIDTKVIGCPFSDHHFLIAALDFTPVKAKPFENVGRSLSEKNLILIVDHINALKFSFNRDDHDIDRIWSDFKINITKILDSVAPLKNFKERPIEISPWEDKELLEKRKARDFF